MTPVKRASYTSREFSEIIVDGKVVGAVLPGKPVELPDEPFKVLSFAILNDGSESVMLKPGDEYQLEAKPKPKRKRAVKNEKA